MTAAVFHPPSGLLNTEHPENIEDILVTAAVFQLPTGLLNTEHPENIPDMLVTAEVFHPLISWLN